MKKRTIGIILLCVGGLLIIYPFVYAQLYPPAHNYFWSTSLTIKIQQNENSTIYLPILVDYNDDPAEIMNHITKIEGNCQIDIINISDEINATPPHALRIISQGNVNLNWEYYYKTKKTNQSRMEDLYNLGMPSLRDPNSDQSSPKIIYIHSNRTINPFFIQWFVQSRNTTNFSDTVKHVEYYFELNNINVGWQPVKIL